MSKIFSKDNKLVQMGNSKIKNRWLILILTFAYPSIATYVSAFVGLIFFWSIFGDKNSMTAQILITFTIIILFYLFVAVVIDKRKISDLGLRFEKGFVLEYLKGFFFGILMISVCFVAILLFSGGKFKFNGISLSYLPTFMFIILAWIVQTGCEELAYRGYMLPLISKRFNVVFGIIISTAMFTVTHFGNEGISPIPVLNLVLFGVFTALYALYSGNIWGVAALHCGWNFALGNVYGFIVSGATNLGKSIITTSYSQGNLLSGGKFGPEGGLAASTVIFIGIIILLVLNNKKSKA